MSKAYAIIVGGFIHSWTKCYGRAWPKRYGHPTSSELDMGGPIFFWPESSNPVQSSADVHILHPSKTNPHHGWIPSTSYSVPAFPLSFRVIGWRPLRSWLHAPRVETAVWVQCADSEKLVRLGLFECLRVLQVSREYWSGVASPHRKTIWAFNSLCLFICHMTWHRRSEWILASFSQTGDKSDTKGKQSFPG